MRTKKGKDNKMPETLTQTNVPICKTQNCKRPLVYLEDSKCWRCLICNPIPKIVVAPKQEKKFLDVALTEGRVKEMLGEQIAISEERIREIVQDELMNWQFKAPPVAADEVEVITETTPQATTWRQEAKALGISLHQSTGGVRKKVDVLADIEAKRTVTEDSGD